MRGAGMGQHNMMGQQIQALDAELETSFRDAVNTALLWAGGAAVLASVVVSWVVSQQIVNPVRALVRLSKRIASGHYTERLEVRSHDEVSELIQSFNQMAGALADSEIMRQRLIADVTHELKTPLASIKGYMEGLQDGVIPASPETFQSIHREASRLQRLVQDLQELSRAESGQMELELQPNDPRLLIEAAVEHLCPQFAEKGIALCTDLPDALPYIWVDRDRTGQVLMNLLGNALQYTPADGRVSVSAARQGTFVRFSVSDTGVGLAAEDRERIFQRFYRVDKSRSRASGGSGIGLTIARYLVEAQGGEIWAESEGAGRGSTFSFTLPIAEDFTKSSSKQHTQNKELVHPVDSKSSL
jgi:histidine kinase